MWITAKMISSVFVVSIFFGTVLGSDENQAMIRFYYNSMSNYTELYIDEAEKILTTSWYDPNKQTVMFCHGFTGHPAGPAVTAVISTYLSLEKYNVALLNWEKLAAIALPGIINSYMNFAVPNALQLGIDLSVTLLRLFAAGLNPNNTHFVGHSLGVHIIGIAGNKVAAKGTQLPWITGLDPAIGFDSKPAMHRLNPASARFVSVIHSDPSKFGSRKELGVVDFWPSFKGIGPVVQPGCPMKAARLSEEENRFFVDFCSHHRAWELFVDSLTHPGTILGSHAKNFRIWKMYTEKQKRATVLEFGIFKENPVPGNYYFTTKGEAPYGLSEDGL